MKFAALAVLLLSCVTGSAQSLSGLCMVSDAPGVTQPAKARLMLARIPCDSADDRSDGCSDASSSSLEWSRWTGVSAEMLQHEGATLAARVSAEPGELTCDGHVHDGVLSGRYQFTPSEDFVKQMESMNFDNISPKKQLGFLLLGTTTAWVRDMKGLGLTELSSNKLMGLSALHVTPDYVRAMSAAGYPELRAGKLTEMKAVGVTPEKVREAQSLGFTPTEQELVQMSIFHIDRPFVERMRARGLHDLTLEKLIKIRIFKVDE
jgi:hypothetical protein